MCIRDSAYIDHNTLQSGFENADDHKYIGSVAKKHGIYYSKAGNGICHQVHLERFEMCIRDRVCAPERTATEVRARAAVAGMPPNIGSTMLPTPCANSS